MKWKYIVTVALIVAVLLMIGLYICCIAASQASRLEEQESEEWRWEE